MSGWPSLIPGTSALRGNSVLPAAGLDHTVGDMSTTVRGNPETVWGLVRTIYGSMESHCRFVLDVRASNVCGCS